VKAREFPVFFHLRDHLWLQQSGFDFGRGGDRAIVWLRPLGLWILPPAATRNGHLCRHLALGAHALIAVLLCATIAA
jgi:hypothetical protein